MAQNNRHQYINTFNPLNHDFWQVLWVEMDILRHTNMTYHQQI